MLEPTRISNNAANLLDLILCSHPDIVANVSCISGLSDHLGLSFKLLSPALKPVAEIKLIYHYDRANFEDINIELANFLDPFFNHFDDRTVDENWIVFENKILELTYKFISSSEISYNVKKPWFSAHLKRLSKKKGVSKCQKKCFGFEMGCLQNAYVKVIKLAKKAFHVHTLSTMLANDPKKFQHVINPSNDISVTLIDSSGSPVPDDVCPQVLNSVFCNNFVICSNSTFPTFVCAVTLLWILLSLNHLGSKM